MTTTYRPTVHSLTYRVRADALCDRLVNRLGGVRHEYIDGMSFWFPALEVRTARDAELLATYERLVDTLCGCDL